MRRTLLAALLLTLVLSVAALRGRLAPRTTPLPPTPRGVVLVVVEGLDARTTPTAFPGFDAYGLIPTRNGTADESDFAAGLRMILAGSRAPRPGAPSLSEVVERSDAPITVYPCVGTGAIRDARLLTNGLMAPGGLPDGVSLLVVGVTPSPAALARRERVAPLLYWRSDRRVTPPRLLTSPSTRRGAGLVAATDVATTVAALLGLPPDQQRIGDGRPAEMLATPPGDISRFLVDRVTVWGLQAREQKRLTVLPWVLAALFAVATFARSAPIRSGIRAALLALPIALIAVAPLVPAPVSTALLGGWTVYALALIPVIVLAGLVAFRPERFERLSRVIALVAVVMLVADTLAGGYLLSRTPFSYSVLEAARFYGIGNDVSGLYLGAALVAVGADVGLVATLIGGAAIAVVSGAPSLGADAGGFVADLAAFCVLALAGRRTARGNREAVLAAVAIVAVVAAFASWDGSRPPSSRTHIGEAVSQARDHGAGVLVALIGRKVAVNLRLLTTSPWSVLLFTEIACTAINLYRSKRRGQVILAPAASDRDRQRIALVAAMIALFVLNDSGVVAGAVCGIWLLAVEPPR